VNNEYVGHSLKVDLCWPSNDVLQKLTQTYFTAVNINHEQTTLQSHSGKLSLAILCQLSYEFLQEHTHKYLTPENAQKWKT